MRGLSDKPQPRMMGNQGGHGQGASNDELDSSDDEDHFPPSQHFIGDKQGLGAGEGQQMAGGPK